MLRFAVASLLLVCSIAQVPYQQGGAQCSTELDCSLGGTCTNGVCVCDVWWTGPKCDLLNLAPADIEQGMQVPGYHSWGGHALPDKQGVYHGFFSFLCNGSTLGSWTTKSSIYHATADKPVGPFAISDMVAQPWAHNAMISQHPDGTYLLWDIGNSVTPAKEWETCYIPPSEGSTPAAVAAPEDADVSVQPPYVTGQRVSQLGNVRNNQLYVRSSASLLGPWTEFANDTGVTVDYGSSWMVNGATGGNPAAFYFPNGTTYLYFTGNPCPKGWGLAPNCIGMAVADSWEGPFNVTSDLPITHPESEDPFVFQDPRGNFHMLTNVNTYHNRCPAGIACGGHCWSVDGLNWSNLTIGAFGPVIQLTNGSYWYNAYVERPQVLQDSAGRPIAFYTGIGRTSYMDSASWAQAFCTEGQTGCGPTLTPPQPLYKLVNGGACLQFNTSAFPCFSTSGGTGCPAYMGDCSAPGAAWAWPQQADAATTVASNFSQGAYSSLSLDVDCNNVATGTLVKVLNGRPSPLSFTNTSGALGRVQFGSACLNAGQGTPIPPCGPKGETYLQNQIKITSCDDPSAQGWSVVPF